MLRDIAVSVGDKAAPPVVVVVTVMVCKTVDVVVRVDVTPGPTTMVLLIRLTTVSTRMLMTICTVKPSPLTY